MDAIREFVEHVTPLADDFGALAGAADEVDGGGEGSGPLCVYSARSFGIDRP